MANEVTKTNTAIATQAVEFSIFGNKLTVSRERVEYNRLRNCFISLAVEQRDLAERAIDKAAEDVDDFCRRGNAWAHGFIDKVAEVAIGELTARGCYDMDPETYIQKYLDTEPWDGAFKRLCAAVEKVHAEEENREEARLERSHAAKNRWVGFNDEGQREADARNFNGGLVQGAMNMVGRGFYALANANKISEIYDRKRDDLLDAIFDTIRISGIRLVDCLEDNGHSLEGSRVRKDDSDKAERLFNNLKAGRLPASEVGNVKMQILGLDPFQPAFYEYVYESEGDKTGELSKVAEFFGVSLEKLKAKALDNQLGECEGKTIHELEDYRKKAESIGAALFFDPKKKLQEIDRRIAALELRLRTTFGKEYKTREEAVAAQGDRNGFYAGIENTIAQTNEAKFYLGDRIPQKRLFNARACFPIPQSEKVIALIDTTIFGSGKTGLSVSCWGLRWLNDMCETRVKSMSWEVLAKQDGLPKLQKEHIIFSDGVVFDSTNSGINTQVLFAVIMAFYEYCHEATFFTDVSPEEPVEDPKVEPAIEAPKAEEPKAQQAAAAPKEEPKAKRGPEASAAASKSAPVPQPASVGAAPKTKNKFVDVYMKNMKRYADFNGRMGKNEFWIFFGCQFVLLLGLSIISGGLLGILYGLAAFLPTAAAVVRRFHDQNRPGAMWLIGLVPIIGIFVVLYFMAQEGTKGGNQYGEEPELL